MQKLHSGYFGLRTHAQLRDFLNTISSEHLEGKELLWALAGISQDPNSETDFDPINFISDDLSSAVRDGIPIIFRGTNLWSQKKFLSPPELHGQTRIFENCLDSIELPRDTNFCGVIVPEKDILVDRLFDLTKQYDDLHQHFEDICIQNSSKNILYFQPFKRLPNWTSKSEYAFYDSHLLSRDYYVIFEDILNRFGLPTPPRNAVKFFDQAFYGDLASKFPSDATRHETFSMPSFSSNDEHISISGSKSFESPLGETTQLITNRNFIVDASVQIFGDSHCSIYDSRKLTYLIANVFRETEFTWNPFRLRVPDAKINADFVIMETAQRFALNA